MQARRCFGSPTFQGSRRGSPMTNFSPGQVGPGRVLRGTQGSPRLGEKCGKVSRLVTSLHCRLGNSISPIGLLIYYHLFCLCREVYSSQLTISKCRSLTLAEIRDYSIEDAYFSPVSKGTCSPGSLGIHSPATGPSLHPWV